MAETKRCARCGETKPTSGFPQLGTQRTLHPARHAAASKRWQQANLDGLVREAVRRRYATRKGARSIYFTPAQLLERAAFFGGRCWVCRCEATEWDHVKPLSRGGWHCLSNLRPACRRCNAMKHNRWPVSTARRI